MKIRLLLIFAPLDSLKFEVGPCLSQTQKQRADPVRSGIVGHDELLFLGVKALDIRIWGITDPGRLEQRLPTVSFTHSRWPAEEIARRLGESGVFVWHGNHYALQLTETLGLEPHGTVRLGLVHYNTADEVERVVAELARL